jgi:hypothetical protein
MERSEVIKRAADIMFPVLEAIRVSGGLRQDQLREAMRDRMFPEAFDEMVHLMIQAGFIERDEAGILREVPKEKN